MAKQRCSGCKNYVFHKGEKGDPYEYFHCRHKFWIGHPQLIDTTVRDYLNSFTDKSITVKKSKVDLHKKCGDYESTLQ